MSFQWDSLRAHTGCLKLFDLRDLTSQIRRLQLRHETQEEANQQPRAFRFQRLTPAMIAERRAQQQQEAAAAAVASASTTTTTTPRLPPLVTEDETKVGTYLAASSSLGGGGGLGGGGQRFPGRGRTLLGENGLVVFVQDDAKIRVMRDRRTKEDLLQVFPDVDEALVEAAWVRTHMIFAAASTILTSLRNSGHTEVNEGEVDMALEDTAVWPSVEEVWGAGGKMTNADCAASVTSSEGWEHVALSAVEGEQWVFLGEEEEEEEKQNLKGAAATAAQPPPFQTTNTEGECAPGAAAPTTTKTTAAVGNGMNYRSALVANLMDMGEGEEWPPAPVRRTLASVAAYGRKKKARLVLRKDAEEGMENDSDDDGMGGGGGGGGGGGFVEEYERYKAVAVRTRKSCGRKRLTETGKRRMAAKLAARAAPRGAGEDEEEGEDW